MTRRLHESCPRLSPVDAEKRSHANLTANSHMLKAPRGHIHQNMVSYPITVKISKTFRFVGVIRQCLDIVSETAYSSHAHNVAACFSIDTFLTRSVPRGIPADAHAEVSTGHSSHTIQPFRLCQ